MTIPASVLTIGNYAFRNCINLATLIINEPAENASNAQKRVSAKQAEGLQHIGRSAFESCPFPTLTLPATVNLIEEEAFWGVNQLADVYCKADAANVEWRGSSNSRQFMPEKATLFHVADAASWQEKYPDANVTFVDELSSIKDLKSGTSKNTATYNLNGQQVDAGYKGIVIRGGRKVMVK